MHLTSRRTILLSTMEFYKLVITFVLALLSLSFFPSSMGDNSKLFREYIGAKFKNVKFTDVPISSDVDFHFILSFAIDYTSTSTPLPTDGVFNIFWDTENLSPTDVSIIKNQYSNVKVALSIGGASVGDVPVLFSPSSIDSWVSNAVSSLTTIIQAYNLDGIDIDYEHFSTDPDTFAECIGRLITTLKQEGIISFASIAPFDDEEVQSHYMALWKKYSSSIDFVNFQFYAYDEDTSVDQFISYFDAQKSNYEGGKILVSFSTDTSGGLKPAAGFFTACATLKSTQDLYGIFAWSADDSLSGGFPYETESQILLASSD